MIGVSGGAAVAAMLAGGLILGAVQDAGQIWRGVLIGLNGGLNLLLGWWLLQKLPFGWALAGGLALIAYLSVLPWVAHARVYHFILGWLSWLMPMSWPIHAIGLAALVLNVVAFLLLGLLLRITFFRMAGFGLHWSEGTFYSTGGWVGNVNRERTAYDLGGVIFVHREWAAHVRGWDWLIAHETGHALSLAAFGWIFHLAEWIDEIIRGANAPAEHMADSNAVPREYGYVPQWGA